MSHTIYRFTAPVGADHVEIGPAHGDPPVVGDVLWAKSRDHNTVDFWARVAPDLTDADDLPPARRFTVTGTGRYVPDKARYCDSTEDATDSRLIWHLWEICAHDYDPLGATPTWCRLCQEP